MRQIIAIASDLQCGGTTAICPPKVELDDGGIYQASKLQKSVYKFWVDIWKDVKEVAGDDEILFVFVGEPGDGNHHRTPQIWTQRITEQAGAALTCLNIPSQLANKVYCLRGTPAHSDMTFDIDDIVAKELGAHKLKAHYTLELEVQGIKFFFKHKGPPPGTKEHTFADGIRRELRDQFYKSIRRGKKPPQYYVWAHYHQKTYATYDVEYKGEDMTLHGYIVPGWQLSTAYISSLIKGEEIIQIGILYFVVEDGVITHHWIVDTRDVTERVKA